MGYSPIPSQPQHLSDVPHALTRVPNEALLWNVAIDGNFSWILKAHRSDNPKVFSSAKIPLDRFPEVITLYGEVHNTDGSLISVHQSDLFSLLKNKYEFQETIGAVSGGVKGSSLTFVIDTVRNNHDMQGRIVRFANELYAHGGRVKIVADMPNQTLANVLCPIDFYADEIERMHSVTSDVIVVSALDLLPLALQCRNSKQQRIIHFCHEIKEHTSCLSVEQLNAHKPLFQLLNALPVERVVLTLELQGYYRCLYSQECSLISDAVVDGDLNDGNSTQMFKVLGENKTPIRCVQRVTSNGEVNGIHVLLEALILCSEVLKQKKHFHLTLLLENGVHNVFYSKQLPATVHLDVQREVTQEVVERAYASSDIYIDSSYVESSGYRALGAMASSISIIKADNGSLKSTPKYQESVVECARGSATNLATAIMCLIENSDVRRDMIIKGRVLARKFSQQLHLEQLRNVFDTIISYPNARADQSSEPSTLPAITVREQPRFSVLVPVYNHDMYLGEALDTLLAQTYPHWEAIVVNDGSTDQTPEVMSRYAREDTRFKIYHKQNGGTASALNAALDKASMPWICWLSSDDFFKQKKLEIHAKYISALPQIKFFHSGYSIFENVNGIELIEPVSTHLCSNRMAIQSLIFCWWNYVHGNTVAIHRDIFDKVGHFSTQYPNAQDFDMWFRMSLVTQLYLIDERTCTTRVHPGMGTTQFPQAGFFDSYRSVVDHLNHMSFEQLFPFVDFGSPREVQQVIKETISIACAPNAFIYQGVLQDSSVLLDKLQEWLLSDKKHEVYREDITNGIEPLVEHNKKNNINTNLIRFVVPLMSRPQEPFAYKPRNTINEFVRTYEYGKMNNRVDVCSIMGRYLNKLRSNNVQGALSVEMPLDPFQDRNNT